MKGLWAVEFNLMAKDVTCDDEPSIDGEMLVRGDDIFEVLDKATGRLNSYCKLGYDIVTIHGARRYGPEKTKGETKNE